MGDKITFFTVCGGGEEYEFLLGGIEHHARVGRHLVLDVSPEPRGIAHLPASVFWSRSADDFGSGDWRTFRMVSALEEARRLALACFPDTDFLVHLDCDEYYDVEILSALLRHYEAPPIETPRIFTFETIHWVDRPGLPPQPLRFGPSEIHMRAWDVRVPIRAIRNTAWPVSPKYNGNPEHHPILSAPPGSIFDAVKFPRMAHYHLHYALGQKRFRTETAEATIDGWPNGTPIDLVCPWPDPLRAWGGAGILPSSRFFT